MSLTSQKSEPSLFILLLLVSFASVSAMLFTPALPEIAQKFAISSNTAQFTMTIFLIGYSVGSLPYGPMAKRFGRKPTLYFGIVLAILGSLLIISVEYLEFFWLFLVGRLLSALGSSVGMKIVFTMIGDVYSQENATKKIAIAGLSFAVAPGIAIALGGMLTKNFGWVSCFYFLILYSLFLFFLATFLPETAPSLDKDALNARNVVQGYMKKCKNHKLITASVLMGCVTGIIYLFSASAPFIGIDVIGLSPEVFGLWNFLPSFGLFLGLILSHRMAGKAQVKKTILIGLWTVIFFSILMFLLFIGKAVNVFSLFFLMVPIYIGEALVFSNVSALAMSHAQDKANASAVMNFINIGLSVIILSLSELFSFQMAWIMPLFFVLIGVFGFFLKRRLFVLIEKG